MGMFVRDDDYNESIRMTGFNRYKQLLSFYAGHWVILGIITCISAVPMIGGIIYALLSKSLLIVIVASLLGGAFSGPFIAALIDSIQRGLREDTGRRWDNYKKGFRQNIGCSILPGSLLGLFIGIYVFIFYMSLYTDMLPLSATTIVLLGFAFLLFINFQNLLWPQLVLFKQPFTMTIRNSILFTAKYLWLMLKVDILEMLMICFIALLAPYTLILIPFLGIWYYCFFSQFMIYDALNSELRIEERFD